MSLLEHPEAKALLADASVTTEDVQECSNHLTGFLERYLPLFHRQEQRAHAAIVVRGLLSGLERKSLEPIARQAGIPKKNLQYFVGLGAWDDDAIRGEMRRHVREEMADPNAVIVLDGSGFPKKGEDSCGVARQWCGRLGKVENCQVGVFLAYVSLKGHAPLDCRLYLPKDWADDDARREACHVPKEVGFRKSWEIAAELLERSGPDVPHGWVVGDDEFGRASEFRARLRKMRERYVLDVPCVTAIRDLERRRPPRKKGKRGRKREHPFVQVGTWAAGLPAERWTKLTIHDGSKGPLLVEAVSTRVRARPDRRVGPEERLLVIRTVEPNPKTTYALSNADAAVDLPELVRARSQRHRIERVFQEAKGEVGLAHYEVRSWVGWHRHVTLSFLALWFLILERGRMGGKNTGVDSRASPLDHHSTAPRTAADGRLDRRRDQPSAAA